MAGNQIIDKEKLVSILAAAFDDNKSVNYIIRQDEKRNERIRALMAYSFDVCAGAGKIFASSDFCSYALVSYPDKRKTTTKSVLRDIKFIFACLGIFHVKKAMARESVIQKGHPQTPFTYLWFIGTEPSQQGKGIATTLLNEIIREAEQQNRPVYLETSTVSNISWYKKFGFKIYRELDFGYKLYCMKRE
jgi:ribosomal protein S18 acetylase RimI-like enzyme